MTDHHIFMNGPQHYQMAEAQLLKAESDVHFAAELRTAALAHAILAVAAAIGRGDEDRALWADVVGGR